MAAPDFKVAPTILGHAVIPSGGTIGQVLRKASGTDYDTGWTSPSRSVSDAHSDSSVVNSTTETTVFTLALPTTLAAGDIVRFTMVGDSLNNTGSAQNLTLKLKLGSTTVLTSVTAAGATSANRHQWLVTGSLLVVAATGSPDQRVQAFVIYDIASSNTWPLSGFSNDIGASGRGTAAEDLSAGPNLILTATLGVASASYDFVCHEGYVEVMKR